jgi:hypothetical protein
MVCCSHAETDALAVRIQRTGFRAHKTTERTVTKFCISSAALVQALAPFGRGAAGKRLPGFVFGAPLPVLDALWQGWLESDGHRFDDGRLSFTTISRDLAVGMARVGRIVTGAPVGLHRQEVPATTVIEGRTVRQQAQYSVHVAPHHHEGFCEDGHCWVPVRSVRALGERTGVYNFEVADDNSYVAGGLVVHNCQDVSVAGLRAGFSGERSSLWREYRRIVAHVRPRFVFLENVAGLASSQGGWDFGEVLGGLADLGYDATWDRFRASDVAAPHRRERIFLLGWLADAACLGEREPADEGIALATRGGARVEPRRGGESPMGDPDGQRLQESGRVGGVEWQRPRLERGRDAHARSQRDAESAVGCRAHGVSARLDDHGWPAGRGEVQRPGEPPRTAVGVAQRAPQLRAYGNACVPQVVSLAWRVLFARAALEVSRSL